MIPELGNLSLILALILSVLQGGLSLYGAQRGEVAWMSLARPLACGQWLFVALSFGALVCSFVANDFSVLYVASHANSLLPWPFRVAATWGGHEGSLLLWQLMLSSWSLAVAWRSAAWPAPTRARVLGVLGLIGVGFLSFTLFTSNPFERLLPVPPDGQDLNPLLQDPGMIFHPPLLYMGYVGFSVAFAMAVTALLSGELDADWAKWVRPWTLAAWVCLTLGILLGSFWAYYELGWGGWWFWDAVENASFMPWLVGTALLHSLAVTEKRGTFRSWTVLLAILAFSLSLLGTFLVRSGVLSSVHAFASDPKRGVYILVFLLIVIGGSLGLYAWRAPRLAPGARYGLLSRESLLLLNNVFLLVTTGTVLLGTLYPLAVEVLGLGRISVGPPYFESVFLPLMVPVLMLLGLGPFVAWKRARVAPLWRRVEGAFWVALACAAGVVLARKTSPGVAAGLWLAAWIISASIWHAWQRLHAQSLRAIPLSFWGMVVAHVGVGVFVLGVTMVKGLDHVQDGSLAVGESVSAGDYTFRFADLQKQQGPNYVAARARFEVTQVGRPLITLFPEKRLYLVQRMPMTEAAIDRGVFRDLYVSIGEASPDGRWGVRVQVKPFMGWVWVACLLMALGGVLAAVDRRYRRKRHE